MMMKMLVKVCLLLLFLSLSDVNALKDSVSGQRVAIANRRHKGYKVGFINNGGKIEMSSSFDNGQSWTKWAPINTTVSYPAIVSNPVTDVDEYIQELTIYLQAADGQAYVFTENSSKSVFEVKKLTKSIPLTLSANECSKDGVKIAKIPHLTYLFVRSQSNRSQIHTGYQDWTTGKWSLFSTIGDDDNHLAYDFDVVVNTYLERIEVFAVVGDKKVKHTWQNRGDGFGFVKGWHEIVLLGSPEFNSAPVAHAMGKNGLNGMIEVFVRDGNHLKHIHQTTCDKVNNPWGPCTWELTWHDQGDLPSDPKMENPFTMSTNIHKGQELFVIGAKDGCLYHLWQPERGDGWSDWENLGTFSNGDKFGSLPFIAIDEIGWWEAYAQSSTGLRKYVQGDLQFTATPIKQTYGLNVTVNWQVPTDQATSEDWIGVYPHKADNHKYVNFRYVGGDQNPRSEPIHKGRLKFINLLPNGIYDYRYLVNKQYINVTSVQVESTNAPVNEPEWVQVYHGIARGLGNLSTNITACVKDGNATVIKFEKAFRDFEDRKIITGLNLLGDALKDVVETLRQCDETEIAEKITKFIEALVACTESNCERFAIDVAVEIVIIYERFYEIYGDILAANNCFKFNAYEMGGLCIGRVTYACLAAPEMKNIRSMK